MTMETDDQSGLESWHQDNIITQPPPAQEVADKTHGFGKFSEAPTGGAEHRGHMTRSRPSLSPD